MNAQNHAAQSKKKPMPILARHAVSLSITFVLALVFSYFAWQYINQQIQLGKLSSPDQESFERGVGYVITKAGESESVTEQSLAAITEIDPQRGADLLLAIAQSHANREDVEEPTIPASVSDAIAPIMQRLDATQAIGLYDALVQVKGINPINCAKHLLAQLNPKDDAELLEVVDLLDTRLLWSKRWAPMDLWVRWLGVLANSDSELTQAQTAKRLGDLPAAADDPRLVAALSQLASSKHETVRNIVLHEVAGYAAIAKDPTDYEQLVFNLGKDENTTIARRAWMIVGHLNPLSGFAVDWKNAGPSVAEAMLWAAVKTNPENTKPVLEALRDPALATFAQQANAATELITFDQLASDATYEHLLALNEDQSNLIAVWRSLLALNAGDQTGDAWSIYLGSYLDQDADPPMMFPLSLASIYRRTAMGLPGDFRWNDQQLTIGALAAIEGLAAKTDTIEPLDELPFSPIAELVAASSNLYAADLETLSGYLPLDEPTLLDLFSLALTHADSEVIDRFIRSSHPQMVTMAAIASAIKGYQPSLIEGIYTALRTNPNLDIEQIRAMSDDELAGLGLRRIDALPALLEAAEAAPPSANRGTEAKQLKLALWIRGDLGEDFTPTAEAMLHDEAMPTSTVLMALLHQQRPVALEYLFGHLVTPRPDLHKLFIQERYWHVFHRFVDTSDLTLWLWGDPESQAFQLEAMRQWYAVNRWKIQQGWWPEPGTEN